MITKWQKLLDHLEINPQNPSDENVVALQQWCAKEVSTDVQFSGSLQDKFAQSKAYLTHYFSTICVGDMQNLTDRESHMRGMNRVQYAALQGYDRYLANILPDVNDAEDLVNNATSVKMTALHFSAFNGHINTTELLLARGALTTNSSRLSQLPLHLALTVPSGASSAVKERKIAIFNLLLQENASLVDREDISGDTVVQHMAQNGFTELLRSFNTENPLLLTKQNHFNKTPLLTALLNKRTETAQFLATIPQLLVIADGDGKLPLHYAAVQDDLPLLKACVAPNSDIDVPDHYHNTALHKAAQAGKLAPVKYLVGEGASVFAEDVLGKTVWHHAVASGSLDTLKWLKNNTSVDPSHTDKQSRTALMQLLSGCTAINADTESLITFLVDSGTDLALADQTGHTAKDYLEQMQDRGLLVSDGLISDLSAGGCLVI